MEAPEFGDQIRGCQQLGNKSGVCYKGAAQRFWGCWSRVVSWWRQRILESLPPDVTACTFLLLPSGSSLELKWQIFSATFPFAWKTSNYNALFSFCHNNKSFFEVNNKKAHLRSNFLIIKFLNLYIFNLLSPAGMPGGGHVNPWRFHCSPSKMDTSQTSDDLQLHALVKKHHRIRKSKSWMELQE